MKSSRKDIIQVALLIENDLSRALGFPCLLYQEAGMCRACQVDSIGSGITGITSIYDAKTLHKVVMDLISIISTIKQSYKIT